MTKKLIALFIALVMLAFPFSTIVNAEEAAPYAVRIDEVETNDTFATAQTIYSDYTVSGSFTSQSDVDIYKITATIDGLANFYLGNIPDDNDYDLEIYDSSYELVDVGVASSGFEQILALPVSQGEVLYVMVRCYQMYNSDDISYLLRARTYLPSYTYYTQVENHTLSYTDLEGIYSSDWAYDWQESYYSEGCVVASCAMVLSNMGAETTSLVADLPNATNTTISNDYLDVSPFTVMMANTQNPSVARVGDNYIVSSNEDPVYSEYTLIANFHGVRTQRFWPGYGDEKQMVVNALSACPQGVCLYFDTNGSAAGGSTHMVVITATTFETEKITMEELAAIYESYLSPAKTENSHNQLTRNTSSTVIALDDGDKFTVYDPYFTGTTPGNGIPLSESYTGVTYDWYDLLYIVVFY